MSVDPSSLLPRCTFPPPGTAVTCAVSGGPDSVALLALAVAAGCAATAVHVDHGLRPGSAAEADVVAAVARELGAGFAARTVHVGPGANLEERAREARYAVLPPDVLTGHTADDQAETVLVNLLRGAGSAGLAGMRAGTRRPLLALRRAEVRPVAEAAAARAGVTLVADPSNDDPAHLRNRIRHEVLPLLDAVAGRDLVPVLARQAALLAGESDLLDGLAAAVDVTDARALAATDPVIARRAVRLWLRAGTGRPPDAATVERVLAVARCEAAACDVGGGRQVRRHQQHLHLTEGAHTK